MKKLIALVLFLGIAPLAHSEDEGPSGTDALQAAGAALVEGDLGRAETLYQEALQSPTLGKKQQASAHYNLGCIYMSQKTRRRPSSASTGRSRSSPSSPRPSTAAATTAPARRNTARPSPTTPGPSS